MTRDEFIGEIDNWCSHRKLLFEALQHTSGKVIELGMGEGSTLQLHEYCKEHNRLLESYDANEEWAFHFEHLRSDIHKTQFIDDWDSVDPKCSLLFVDHSPGERRKIDIERAFDKADVIVVHDTEPSADHGYQMRDVLKKFRYMVDDERDGAWTTAVSNTIEVTKWLK